MTRLAPHICRRPHTRTALGIVAALLALSFTAHAQFAGFIFLNQPEKDKQGEPPAEGQRGGDAAGTGASNASAEFQQYWLDPGVRPGAPPCVVNFQALNLTQTPVFEHATQDSPPGVDAAQVVANQYAFLGMGPDAWLMDVDSENARRGWCSFQGTFIRPALLQVALQARERYLNRRGMQMDAENRRLNYQTHERVQRDAQFQREMASQQRKFAAQEDSAAQSQPADGGEHSTRAEEHRQQAATHDANADAAEKGLNDMLKQFGGESAGANTEPAPNPGNAPVAEAQPGFSETELRIISWCTQYCSFSEIRDAFPRLTPEQSQQMERALGTN